MKKIFFAAILYAAISIPILLLSMFNNDNISLLSFESRSTSFTSLSFESISRSTSFASFDSHSSLGTFEYTKNEPREISSELFNYQSRSSSPPSLSLINESNCTTPESKSINKSPKSISLPKLTHELLLSSNDVINTRKIFPAIINNDTHHNPHDKKRKFESKFNTSYQKNNLRHLAWLVEYKKNGESQDPYEHMRNYILKKSYKK